VQSATAGIPGNEFLVWNTAETGARLDEPAQELHLASRRPLEGIDPIAIGVVDGVIAMAGKTPDGVVAVGDAACSGEDGAVDLLAYVVIAEVAGGRIPAGPGVERMILVELGSRSRVGLGGVRA